MVSVIDLAHFCLLKLERDGPTLKRTALYLSTAAYVSVIDKTDFYLPFGT